MQTQLLCDSQNPGLHYVIVRNELNHLKNPIHQQPTQMLPSENELQIENIPQKWRAFLARKKKKSSRLTNGTHKGVIWAMYI